MQTVWDHIRLAAERTPDHIAMQDDRTDRVLTFAELVREVETVAAGFADAGVGRRRLQMPRRPDCHQLHRWALS